MNERKARQTRITEYIHSLEDINKDDWVVVSRLIDIQFMEQEKALACGMKLHPISQKDIANMIKYR